MDEKVRQEFTPRPTAQAPGDGDAEQRMEGQQGRRGRERRGQNWPRGEAGGRLGCQGCVEKAAGVGDGRCRGQPATRDGGLGGGGDCEARELSVK